MNEYNTQNYLRDTKTAFRQWRGKANFLTVNFYMDIMEFKVTFTGLFPLDQLNWVCDFGSFKRNGIKEHLSYMFDHTTVVAKDDPQLEFFKQLSYKNLIQLRVINDVDENSLNMYLIILMKLFTKNLKEE